MKIHRNLTMITPWLLLLGITAIFTTPGSAQQETTTNSDTSSGSDLSEVFTEIMSNIRASPPVDPPEVWINGTTKPIRVVFASLVQSIDDISPSASEFTVTLRNMLYYPVQDCNQTAAHQLACSLQTIHGLHFLQPIETKDEPIELFSITIEDIHQSELAKRGLADLEPTLDAVFNQVTFKQVFDVKTYPFEYHYLDITFASLFTSNVVNISSFLDADALQPTVPPGWTFHSVECKASVGSTKTVISEYTGLTYPIYTCRILVTRDNAGWWLSSFLLFAGLNLISYMGGLGVASHLVAEGRDDKDQVRQALFNGMRMIGVFSIGLLLTYVFQVQVSPYNMSVEFWPHIAASTAIYALGLTGILLAGIFALLSSLLIKRVLVEDGFVGNVRKPYNMAELPVEGKDDDHFPLIWKREHQKCTTAKMDQVGTVKEEEEEPFDAGNDVGQEEVVDGGRYWTPTRRVNMKVYPILAMEEAAKINQIVRIDFVLRTVRSLSCMFVHTL